MSGEVWRPLTGHLAHWSWDHLIWDCVVFVTLGFLCELRYRKLTYLTLITSAILIPLVFAFFVDLDRYGGLSGLVTSLFALLVTSLFFEQWQKRDRLGLILCALLFLGMIGKLTWELVTGEFLVVGGSDGTIEPVPLAHMTGAVIGTGWKLRWPQIDTPPRNVLI